jgi:hypothetical protein
MTTWTHDDAERFARQGWDTSLQRLRVAWDARDAEACMVALYEALTWARALDESLDENRPDRPEILKAVRFARNRALHGLVLLVEPHLGVTFPRVFPSTFPGALTWVHSDQIDRPTPPYADPVGMHAFERHFQRKPVFPTMLDVDHVLR